MAVEAGPLQIVLGHLLARHLHGVTVETTPDADAARAALARGPGRATDLGARPEVRG